MLTGKSEHWISINPLGGIKEVSEHHAATGCIGIPLRGRRVGAAETS